MNKVQSRIVASVTFPNAMERSEFDRLNTLYQLLTALTRAKTLADVYAAATTSLSSATDADRAAILLFDAQNVMRFEAWHDLSAEYRQAVTGHTPWPPGTRDAKPIVVSDVLLDDSCAPYRDSFARENIRALVFIPLEGEDGVFGKFMLYYARPHICSESELAVAQVIASHVALCIERKRLETSSLYVAAIVQNSDEAIVSKDLNGIVTSWNPAAERLFGYTASEMIGKPIAILAAPDIANEMPMILEKLRRGEHISHYETRRRRKDGRIIDVSLTVSPVRNDSGQIIGASKIARDVTEQKRVQRELKRSIEELRRANQDLETFAYSASHDLREPLRTIVISAQMLGRRYKDQLPPAASELLHTVISGAQRMESMIRDVLAYATATRYEETAPDAVEINEVLASVVQDLDRLIREADATVTWGKLPVVSGHANRFAQVFQNLISNALKYRRPDSPRVHISATQKDRSWVFSVSDNGIGIDPAYAKHIFGLFKRLHGQHEYPGSGIGLAVCQRIVEQYGGHIWLERSTPGEGSTFCFTLPVRAS